MKITKLGHCCMVIEENGLRILTDPGTYSESQNNLEKIDIILITHEHADHFHIDSLKIVLKNNPQARIITNNGVKVHLDAEGIACKLLTHGQTTTISGVLFEAFGEKHAEIYKTLPSVDNTGYFIANKLFYPGDAFVNPGKQVDVLALAVAGPWLKISNSVEYALEIKPKRAFPVHDGILKNPGLGHYVPSVILPQNNIEWSVLELEKEYEF